MATKPTRRCRERALRLCATTPTRARHNGVAPTRVAGPEAAAVRLRLGWDGL